MFRAAYLERKLNEGGNLLRMPVSHVSGVAWGLFRLMGGEEKPQRYTGPYHYILYVLRGRACLTIGDEYKLPCTDIPVTEGFSAEVPRGNFYSIRNVNATAPVMFVIYKTPGPKRTTSGGMDEGEQSRRESGKPGNLEQFPEPGDAAMEL
jgi:hypothetical protein